LKKKNKSKFKKISKKIEKNLKVQKILILYKERILKGLFQLKRKLQILIIQKG